jgi:Protein of unknown function (DUF3047)
MRARLVAILLLSLATVAGAQAQTFVVDDWTKPTVGTKGLPPDWKAQNWGSPKYDFEVVMDENQRALRMKSANEGSLASRDIKGKVNLKETPIIEWSWKVTTLPKGGDSCKKATDDQAVQVYVVWPRFPEAVRSRILGYVWDTTEPVGTVCKSEKTGTVTYFVIRSGTADLGKWLTERRNVCEDYKKVYNEDCEPPSAVSVAIDSNDTSSTAESFIGAIFFKRP